jgi:hypothetical protein
VKTKATQRDTTNDRKVEHIRVINTDEGVDRRKYYFDEIRLRHRALPELDLRDVDTATTFLGKRLSFPLLISCMTGGDHTLVRTDQPQSGRGGGGVRRGHGRGLAAGHVHPKARASFDLRRVRAHRGAAGQPGRGATQSRLRTFRMPGRGGRAAGRCLWCCT